MRGMGTVISNTIVYMVSLKWYIQVDDAETDRPSAYCTKNEVFR